MIRNIKDIKTTLLGLFLYVLAYICVRMEYDFATIIGLIIFGTALILSPDSVVSFISNYFRGTGNKK